MPPMLRVVRAEENARRACRCAFAHFPYAVDVPCLTAPMSLAARSICHERRHAREGSATARRRVRAQAVMVAAKARRRSVRSAQGVGRQAGSGGGRSGRQGEVGTGCSNGEAGVAGRCVETQWRVSAPARAPWEVATVKDIRLASSGTASDGAQAAMAPVQCAFPSCLPVMSVFRYTRGAEWYDLRATKRDNIRCLLTESRRVIRQDSATMPTLQLQMPKTTPPRCPPAARLRACLPMLCSHLPSALAVEGRARGAGCSAVRQRDS